MKIALVQLNTGQDVHENLVTTTALIQSAIDQGAEFILTPEVSNGIILESASRDAQLAHEKQDETLATLQNMARDNQVAILIGSLALKTNDPDGRLANRSFLIDPAGNIVARYDKIHMFDVDVSETETYRESRSYRPGERAVLASLGDVKIGMTICYDVRFPHLYRDLAQAGADILTVPAAFSTVTGAAHWETLLRARAIETGCFVLAPAQCGTHGTHKGVTRKTYGHSLVVSPWGDILADVGTEAGTVIVELDLQQVASARKKIPSLMSKATYKAGYE
jgi:predicted amidohydrolase